MPTRKKTTTKKATPAKKAPAKKATPAKKAPAKKVSKTSEALQAKLDKAREEALAEAEIEKQEALEAQRKELQAKAEVAAEEAVKEANKTIAITIKHGLSRQHTVRAKPESTIGQILSDPDLRAVLAFGENVKVVHNGRTMEANQTIASIGENQTVSLETQENRKA